MHMLLILCLLFMIYHFVICVIQFLRCREAWLTGILDDLDQRNPYEYLKGMVNCHRMHLFDVVNQYRAIFADDTSGSEENYDGGLLFSWAMHQITSHLKMLKLMLPKITEGGSLSNILDQCMASKILFGHVFQFLCAIMWSYFTHAYSHLLNLVFYLSSVCLFRKLVGVGPYSMLVVKWEKSECR